MASTVLLSGGAGFIGCHTADFLEKNGFNVIIADKKKKIPEIKFKYYQIDLTSDKLEQIFLNNNVDYVIHLAAMPSVTHSINFPQKNCMDNYYATVNICSLALKYSVKKFVFSSTAAVYSNPEYLPIDEYHPCNHLLSPYAINKKASEDFIKYSGIKYVIFRYSNVYGQGQSTEGEAGVVAIFFDKMLKNLPVEIYGNGLQTRDFIYVKDVAELNVSALKLNSVINQTVNISTNTQCSINNLFQTIKSKIGYTKNPIYSPARKGDILHSVLNNKKLMELFGKTSFTSITQGINLMCNDYQYN